MEQNDNQVRKEVYEKLLRSSSTHYLAFMSIVQGAVLGYGIATLTLDDSVPMFKILLMANTFLTILCVWDEYQFGAAVYEWIPGLRDTFIPFTMGAFEFLLVRSLNLQVYNYWFCFQSLVAFAGVIALWNMFASSSMFEKNKHILAITVQYRDKYYYGLVILSLIQMVFAFTARLSNVTYFSLITFAFIVGFLFVSRLNRKTVIRYAREGMANQAL